LLCTKSFLTHNSTPYQIVFKSLTFGLLFGGRVSMMAGRKQINGVSDEKIITRRL
jgi:hypothetical protein